MMYLFARYGSTADVYWHQEVHILIPFPHSNILAVQDTERHIPDNVKARARQVFPSGDLIFKGVYTRRIDG